MVLRKGPVQNRKTLFYSVHFYFVTTVKYTNITLQGLTKSETQKVIGGKNQKAC